ncbi:MAG TPA: hypothetical protein VMV62_01945 [Candidatus Paceibacterota bacterium]|nr:hypothetical protein [Candidatus Paceibacterota bacterium]
MRRTLVSIFATLTLILGATGAAPAAHAQTPPTQNQINAANELGTPAQQAATGQGTAAQQAAAALTTQQAQALAQKTAANTPTPPHLEDAPAQFGTVMTWIMSLFAWLVGVAAMTLDYAVYYTVVTMGSYVHKLNAVGVAWRILRDIGNIALIFGFLAVGITTILNVDWYGGGKKMLPMMLLAAVFLNFSLFFSEAIIDVGNLFATQFYTQINGGKTPTSDFLSTVNPSNEGISNKIMAQLGLQTIYNPNANPAALAGGHTWIVGFMGIILFIITAFVMFSLAFILIARFVTLIFIIILAPVGFAGLAVPMLAKRARQWWDTLFAQTITAPILLLLLYVSLAVITDAQFLSGFNATGSWLDYINNYNLAGFGGMMLSFLVAIGLLLITATQAKRLSAFGASVATQTAGKLTLGATAWAGTKAIGLPSHYVAQRIRTSGIAGTRTGRVLASTFDRGAKASFDIRGSKAAAGLESVGLGLGAGKAAEGGYRGQRDRTIKEHEEYIKSIDKAHEERGPNAQEEERIEKAVQARTDALGAQSSAKEAKDVVQARVDRHAAEVARLADIDAENRKRGVLDQKTLNELKAAQQNLASGKEDLAAATSKLATADKVLTAADTEKTAAEKAPGDRMKEEKTSAKVAYAGRVGTKASENPIMWAVNLGMYGPGGAQAARKIIKEATKKETEEEKLIKAIKAAGKKEAEAAAKEPGAAAPAAAPAQAAESH